MALHSPGIRVVPSASGGLEVSADVAALDTFVIALGRAGIAVSGLERRPRSLESLFFDLTTPRDLDATNVAEMAS